MKFNSQGDITLNSTTATAERIDVNAKGDLRIESKQDINNYNSKGSQAGISVDVSFGNAWSVSGFASGEKGKSSYKQVNEQAGLIAGKGGYHIEANNVHLKGSTIASTTPNNSELRTNRLTFNDIQNES
ncbi:hemagglutinin repeat-containing protein, partial [Histophilus somni]